MHKIKLDEYQRILNRKMPTLLTMSNLNFEKAAFLWKSYKTQLAVFFISCCFIPVSNALLNGRNLLMVTENFG